MPHLYNFARAFLEKIPWQAQMRIPLASFLRSSLLAAIIVPPVSMISSIIKQYLSTTDSPLMLVITALFGSGRYLFNTAIGKSPNSLDKCFALSRPPLSGETMTTSSSLTFNVFKRLR